MNIGPPAGVSPEVGSQMPINCLCAAGRPAYGPLKISTEWRLAGKITPSNSAAKGHVGRRFQTGKAAQVVKRNIGGAVMTDTDHLAELAVKTTGRDGGKKHFEGAVDLGPRAVVRDGGTVQSYPPHGIYRRFARHGCMDAVKVKSAGGCHIRQRF